MYVPVIGMNTVVKMYKEKYDRIYIFFLAVGKSFKLFKFIFILSWVQTNEKPEVSGLLEVRNVLWNIYRRSIKRAVLLSLDT